MSGPRVPEIKSSGLRRTDPIKDVFGSRSVDQNPNTPRDIYYRGEVILRIRVPQKDKDGRIILTVEERTRRILYRLQNLFQGKNIDPRRIKIGVLNGQSVIYLADIKSDGTIIGTATEKNLIMTLLGDDAKKSCYDWVNTLRKKIDPNAPRLEPNPQPPLQTGFFINATQIRNTIPKGHKVSVIPSKKPGYFAIMIGGARILQVADQRRAEAIRMKIEVLLKDSRGKDIKFGLAYGAEKDRLDVTVNGRHLFYAYPSKGEDLGKVVAWLKNLAGAMGKEMNIGETELKEIRDKMNAVDDIALSFIRRFNPSQAKRIWSAIKIYSKQYGLDPLWVACLVAKESGFHPGSRNPICFGLGQIRLIDDHGNWTPRLGLNQSNWSNIEANIRAACMYLSDGMKRGRIRATAGYNAGHYTRVNPLTCSFSRQFLNPRGSLDIEKSYDQTKHYVYCIYNTYQALKRGDMQAAVFYARGGFRRGELINFISAVRNGTIH